MKFSIVTACLNRRDLIGDAINSVLGQDYPEFEHLIVDGGSTDGSLDLFSAHPHLKVVSEPDEGIYDAWNKGLARCSGDVVGILNSDDLYGPDVFSEVSRCFIEDPALQVVTGRAIQFAEEGPSRWRLVHEYREMPGDVLDPERLIFWGPIINARFFRAEFLARLGGFDRRYRIASDCDFMLRASRERPRAAYVDRCFCYYRSHAGSTSLNEHGGSDNRSYSEKLSIAEEWLAGDVLSAADRLIVRARHSEMAAIATLGFLRRGQLDGARSFFRRGARWPWSFTGAVSTEVIRILRYQLEKRRPGAEARFMKPLAIVSSVGHEAKA